MAYTNSQNKATQKYIKEKYDQISIRIPKGKREIYKSFAESKGMSLNQFVIDLVEKEMGKA